MQKSTAWPVLALPLLLMGCEEEAGPELDRHETAPGFVELTDAYFSLSCAASACHGPGNGAAGLSFEDAEAAYEHLLNAVPVNPIAAEEGQALVAPGELERSFLWSKLAFDNASLAIEGHGARMPVGGLGAPGERSLEAIREWIEAGAPLHGQPFEADFTNREENSLYVECDGTTEEELHGCFGGQPDEGTVRFFSEVITVPPGEEVLLCTYLDEVTTESLAFRSFRARQMTGGHHSAFYVAFQPEEPGLRGCSGAAMTNLRILAGAFSGTDGLVPDDVRLELPAGRQVVIQSHYINPTNEPISVMDAVDLTLTTVEQTPTLADSFVLNMDGFEIPPGATAHPHGNGDGCRVSREIALHSIQLHMHEHGVLMELTHTPDGEEPYVLFSETDGIQMREGAAALLLDPPLELGEHDILQVHCEWENDTEESLGFPDEMCAAFMYYTPGEGFLLCDDDDTEPRVLGAGNADEGCVSLGAPGNELGVGRYCTNGGTECLNNGEATLCLATFDARANFCSLFGCESDEDCGSGASCVQQTVGSACAPANCVD